MWWYVYILKSLKNSMIYVGSTGDLKKRLSQHNNGENQSTKAFLPWELEASIAVRTEKQARKLEMYLKKGSGKTFLKKRILTVETFGKLNQPIPDEDEA